ncbi:MAG: hypothetical protein WBW37_16200 [Methyloceanibacter sp.]
MTDTPISALSAFDPKTPVLPPFGDPNYILIHDLADRNIYWIRTQHAAAPVKPHSLTD